MPELPEVEITARLLDAAVAGAHVRYARAPGINALKTFDPPLSELAGRRVAGVSRRGKHLVVRIEDASAVSAAAAGAGAAATTTTTTTTTDGEPLVLLVHLMSAGRLQLYDKPAGARDRTSRLLVGLDDGRELRLREFGSKQAAWVKLLRVAELEHDHALAGLGPEAWPAPPELDALLDAPRPLHALLRDQHVIAGIGRSWVDEILWEAQLSPYKRGGDLQPAEAERLREAIADTLDRALAHYEHTIAVPIPDKLPMPLRVHRHQGEPCPRCATRLEAVHFEDYVIAYCPACQTDGRVLKDRRLSRLLR